MNEEKDSRLSKIEAANRSDLKTLFLDRPIPDED